MLNKLKQNLMAKLADRLAPLIAARNKAETPVELEADKMHGNQRINRSHYPYGSREGTLSKTEAQNLLSLSFQRGPQDFHITQADGKTYAMDEECNGLSVRNMFGIDGVASAVIYTFFAKHGFIGWQLCSMLSQHWIISRACTIPNQDALAPGWSLDWQEDEEEEPEDEILAEQMQEEKARKADLLVRAVETANQKFKLAERALRFGINRSIYGQAIAYFEIEGEDPATPLNIDGVRPGSFKGISIVEPYWAFPDWGEDAMTPGTLNFYQPEFYTIGGKRIHKSRLVFKPFIEVPDILKPSYYFGGIPLPQMIYERVYAAEKTANEVPELALTKRMLVADANMADLVANPEAMRLKMDILSRFRNNNGVYFKDRPEAVTQLDTNLSDLDNNVWTQYQLVAAVAEMPSDRLLGTSPKGFQSTGEYERRTYAQTCKAYQENAFREFVEKGIKLTLKSEFDCADPFILNFNPIDTPTQAEKAQTQLTQANRDIALVNAGIISPDEARQALSSDKESGYSNLSPEAPQQEMPEDLAGLLGGGEDTPEDDENPEEGGEMGNGADTATDSADWKEQDHPRDEDGKFSSNGNGAENKESENTPARKSIAEFLGPEYTGVKGQAAVEKLLKEKKGHVKAAFTREDIGDIDLVWGDEDQGIAHLIKSRQAKNPYNPKDVLDHLAEVVEKGVLRRGRSGNFEIWHKGILVIVRPDYYGDDIRFVVTGFKQREPNKNSTTREDAIQG